MALARFPFGIKKQEKHFFCNNQYGPRIQLMIAHSFSENKKLMFLRVWIFKLHHCVE